MNRLILLYIQQQRASYKNKITHVDTKMIVYRNKTIETSKFNSLGQGDPYYGTMRYRWRRGHLEREWRKYFESNPTVCLENFYPSGTI